MQSQLLTVTREFRTPRESHFLVVYLHQQDQQDGVVVYNASHEAGSADKRSKHSRHNKRSALWSHAVGLLQSEHLAGETENTRSRPAAPDANHSTIAINSSLTTWDSLTFKGLQWRDERGGCPGGR
jgi:hypothetical protein